MEGMGREVEGQLEATRMEVELSGCRCLVSFVFCLKCVVSVVP